MVGFFFQLLLSVVGDLSCVSARKLWGIGRMEKKRKGIGFCLLELFQRREKGKNNKFQINGGKGKEGIFMVMI